MCLNWLSKFFNPPVVPIISGPVCIPEVKVLEVTDVVDTLPWHPTKRWGTRTLSVINKIIVHQTLSKGTMQAVNKYHITPAEDNHISATGAPHICYHFVIEKDGTIYKTNKVTHIVWHCTGQNTASIGILVMGNFDAVDYKGTEKPTEKQIKSLGNLLDAITKDNLEGLKITKLNIFGHCDFGKLDCPGTRLYSFIQEYKKS
ncbi:MAG TPA: peptidoglycan recognition family protein [Bacteroidales bacterium]|nr:peptidoglycan recognition family protein [Bacteroidales bacterium]